MSSQRERHITSIFHSAIEREPHERGHYLDGACMGDEELRREVEELIKSHESAGSLIDAPAYERGAELLHASNSGRRAGTSIGPYQIISLLGAGGMGEVYRAHDARLGREVALKLLPDSPAGGSEGVRRFQQEARAASALNHPNILAIYDIGEHEGSPYIVSELLEGQTLREKLNVGAIPTRSAVDYALQTARGLAAAHEKGIVHRDLKPENLFVTKDGRVKILDFGIAKLVRRTARGELHTEAPTLMVQTDPGMVIGTVGYMSPEQVRGQAVDTRSDIFAFGAILYEALSGRRAFRGESQVETMNAILKEDPAELTSTNGQIAPGIERVMRRCLEKQPEQRFQSASDLAFAIESISTAQVSGATTAASPATTKPQRLLSISRLGWIVAALSLLSTVVLAVLYFRRVPVTVPAVSFYLGLPEGVVPDQSVETHNMSVSPDGKYLAYVVISAGHRELWLRPMSSLVAQGLPGTEGAQAVFWSPDSHDLAFSADDKLKRIDVTGKSLQTICNLPTPGRMTGSWGSQATIVFSADNDGNIYRVPANGGTPSLLVENKSRNSRRWLNFLPDGRRFLFYKHNEGENNQGVFAGSLDSSEIKQVASMGPARVQYVNGYLLYPRDGSLVARPFDERSLRFTGEATVVVQRLPFFHLTGWAEFSASDTGVLVYMTDLPKTQLVWLDRGGRKTEQIGKAEDYAIFDNAAQLRLSPDGQRAALCINDARSFSGDLWIQDLTRQTRTLFVSGPTDDADPVWSPDGQRLAYFSCCDDVSTLHIANTGDAGKATIPIPDQRFLGPYDWSQDGRFIIYQRDVDLWVLPLFGDGKPYAFMRAESAFARFSPDGRWVAFESDETGRKEVYVTRFEKPGEKWRISTEGGSTVRWRRDGRELFYLANDGRLMSVPMTPGPQFLAGTPVALFKADAFSMTYDVIADGQRFLFISSAEGIPVLPFAVTLNWTADLKQ